jgi:hypothetical protein
MWRCRLERLKLSDLKHVSWSNLGDTLDRCPRRWEMQYLWRLSPREPSLAMEFGTAGHKGLGAYYDQKRSVSAGMEMAQAQWKQWESLAAEDAARRGEKLLYSKGKLEEILLAYHRVFAPVEEGLEDLGGEIELLAEVPGIPVPFKMVLDRAFRDLGSPDKEVVVMEWKFSKSVWGFVSRPNNQVVGYAVGAAKMFGSPVRRVLFHTNKLVATSVDGVAPVKKKGEPGRSIFERDPIDLEEWDFQEWGRDMLYKWRMLEVYNAHGYYPKVTQSCGDFGGCPFQGICLAPPNQREFFAESNFVQREVRE